jgi:hypothetical protein
MPGYQHQAPSQDVFRQLPPQNAQLTKQDQQLAIRQIRAPADLLQEQQTVTERNLETRDPGHIFTDEEWIVLVEGVSAAIESRAERERTTLMEAARAYATEKRGEYHLSLLGRELNIDAHMQLTGHVRFAEHLIDAAEKKKKEEPKKTLLERM